MDAPEKRRWYYPTPGWLVLGSLAATGLLWLSDWFALPAWHKGYAVLVAVASVGVAFLLLLLWFLVALLFRLRFQFKIRTLLALVVAVALPCSWLAVEMKKAITQHDLIEAIGVRVVYDYESGAANAEPVEPAWLRKLLGDDFFANAVGISFVGYEVKGENVDLLKGLPQLTDVCLRWSGLTDDGLEHLNGLDQLRGLDVSNNRFTDAQLKHLRGLTQLRELDLSETEITDDGLVYLTSMTQLRGLDLSDTDISDAGLKQLTPLTQLENLDLRRTQVTDAGLENLKALTGLKMLFLDEPLVGGLTDTGVKKLQEALPNCDISR